MSNGQWEVVGKKKAQNGKVKMSKDDSLKSIKNGPKLDDLLPQSQIKTFYAGMEMNDEKKPGKENKKKDGEKKQSKKQNNDKKAESKPKPPKNLEEALQMIDASELANIITSNKLRFSNAPVIWLKEVALFLNSKMNIDVEDPTFSNHPHDYPTSVLPAEVKKLLEDTLKDAGLANKELIYGVTLTALANDMSRGLPVNGHRILLQMLALENPEFCLSSISKGVNLRNSYQNRPPIGLSLLWAMGQGGYADFSVGLQVWQDMFFPIAELKNYTKYIISYLRNILERNNKLECAKLTADKLIGIIDLVNTKRSNITKEQSSDLSMQLSKLKDICFNGKMNKHQVTFNHLMKKLPNQYLSGSSLDAHNRIIVECLVDCLWKDDSCNVTWRQLFHKCSKQSATLLDYINENWAEVSSKLKLKSLKVTVTDYKEIGAELLKGKKKDEVVLKTNKACQDILDRMTSNRRFPWLWASFFLLVSIVGLVAYDVSRVGGHFPKSTTGRLLNDLGILEQSQYAWQKTLSTSARGYIWVENNAPIYYTKTIEVTKPYAELARDAAIIAWVKIGDVYGNIKDYAVEKSPVVASTIEHYVPGLIGNVQSYSANGWALVKKYSTDYYQFTGDYLKTKVFVGDWAPEILQNKTEIAYNATKTQVSSYFHWFRQQVVVYSEIP